MKTGLIAIVQARLSSTRLPGKVLMPFAAGTVLSTLISRLSKSKALNQIIVATSSEASDDSLANYVNKMGWALFRGPLNNVHDRFRRIIQAHKEETIVRITADCPLVCASLLDDMYRVYTEQSLDFLSNSHPLGIVRGFDLEIFSRASFLKIEPNTLNNYQREHVTPYFYTAHGLKTSLINYKFQPNISSNNYSIDTMSDYYFLRAMETKHQISSLCFSQIMQTLGVAWSVS